MGIDHRHSSSQNNLETRKHVISVVCFSSVNLSLLHSSTTKDETMTSTTLISNNKFIKNMNSNCMNLGSSINAAKLRSTTYGQSRNSISFSLDVPTADRRRSKSLCVATNQQSQQNKLDNLLSTATAATSTNHRRTSNSSTNPIAPLSRLRIQTCFRQAKADIGDAILKRTMASRSEIRQFLGRLGEEKIAEVSRCVYDYLVAVVDSIDDLDEVSCTDKSSVRVGVCRLHAFQLISVDDMHN